MADKTLRKKNESATSDNVSATSFLPAKDAPIIALAGNPCLLYTSPFIVPAYGSDSL